MARPLWDQYAEVSARFEDDRGDRLHSGVDFNSFRLKEEFTTPVWGPVVRNDMDSVFGCYTIQRIEALNGLAGVNWYLLFGHQDSRSPHPYGHWLNPDDFMGWVGMTGQVAGANPWHLHVGLATGDDTIGPSAFWAGGQTLRDPLPLIRAAIDGHPWQSPWGPVWVNGEPKKPLGPMQRKAIANVNIRTAANTSSDVVGVFPSGGVLDVEAFERGETVSGTDIWFYRDGQFFHASGFEDQDTHDLPVRVPPVEPTPDPIPEPVEPETPVDESPVPTEPETDPIEEAPVPPVTPKPVDPGPPIHPGHSKGAMESLRGLLSPTVRVYIYVIFGVIGVALGTWQTWLVSTDQLAPWYFAGVVAVYAYLGTFIAILAAPNTKAER